MDAPVGYRHVLRRQWSNLIRDLPEPSDLLSDPVLKPLFSVYEHNEIRSSPTAIERNERLVRAIERKGEDVYRAFVTVLTRYRPSLADVLIKSAEESAPNVRAGEPISGAVQQVGAQHRPGMLSHRNSNNNHLDDTEDAGAFDFNSCRPGPSYHLQHMSITCRHSLADEINQSAMFPQFCQALGVDDDLRRKASRSRNPTAYLLQEYQELPEATFDRLEQALSQMGRKDLFDQVWQLMQNSVH